MYLLSETGRKASLLSGGNGRAVQQIQVQVPVNRLHLVSVSGKGVARLKLRPRFERDGEDLYTEMLVTYPQLVLGSDVEVPSVMGNVSLRVPAGTQSGQVFHLRGRGLPRVTASGAGDLQVRVELWTPCEVGGEEADLIRRVATLERPVPASSGGEKGFWAKMRDALGA
jgi:molecular chaperone DnaJ